MIGSFVFPAGFALLVAGVIVLYESSRVARHGADSMSLFMLIFGIQCVLPLACLGLFFSFASDRVVTEIPLFDGIYEQVRPLDFALAVACAAMFAMVGYLAYAVTVSQLSALHEWRRPRQIGVHRRAYVLIVVVGLLSGVYLLLSFGNGLLGGYASLVRFRNLDESIERGFVNANLFSLTQTFLFVGMLAPFVMGRANRLARAWPIWFLIVAVLASFGVSRRAVFIPVFFSVLVVLLRKGRVGILGPLIVGMLAGIVVVFGKPFLNVIAGNRSSVDVDPEALARYVLLFVSDVGISAVESLGTIAMIDVPLRFGIDHLFSILRRIPTGMMGLEPFLPERFVRYSTEVFLGPDALDVPPGFLGQMWIDFWAFGPVVYGLVIGPLLGCIETVRRGFVNDWPAAALFSLFLFVFALPLNTGSLDFNFYVDIVGLFLLAFFFVRTSDTRGAASSSERLHR
ncbi:MAG: hypothetical protein LT103_02615 [Burkholderiaceae bacterium]|nr:hypothetical protein [Burkholderiaceae bacterium]